MPSTKKLLHFLSSALLCAAGVGVLGYGMSTDWTESIVDCSPKSGVFNSNITSNSTGNGTSDRGFSKLQIGLFNGTEIRKSCPRFDTLDIRVKVFDRLFEMGGAPVALHVLVVVLLVLALVGSAGSLLVTLYNSFSNPYQTYMGPIGLYACSGFSACSATLAFILYVVNVFAAKLFQTLVLADVNDEATKVKLELNKAQLLVGFYLVIPYICTNLLAILVVFLYVHAAHTRRKEQEKPTEDAPKEIMMY